MRKLRTPNTLELSLANIDASSVTVDWSAHEESDLADVIGVPLVFDRDYDLVYPAPTYGDIDGHASDLFNAKQQATADKSPDRVAPDALREAFEESDAYDEWRAGFDPMMNFVWPVHLGYEVSAETAAQLIAEFAPTCTLISFADDDRIGERHGIALSGGGMNLADQLAVAYLCCGCVPPTYLLGSLPGVIDAHTLAKVRAPLAKAYKRAAAFYKRRAATLGETWDRLAKPAR